VEPSFHSRSHCLFEARKYAAQRMVHGHNLDSGFGHKAECIFQRSGSAAKSARAIANVVPNEDQPARTPQGILDVLLNSKIAPVKADRG
jgi:hypothetical protein